MNFSSLIKNTYSPSNSPNYLVVRGYIPIEHLWGQVNPWLLNHNPRRYPRIQEKFQSYEKELNFCSKFLFIFESQQKKNQIQVQKHSTCNQKFQCEQQSPSWKNFQLKVFEIPREWFLSQGTCQFEVNKFYIEYQWHINSKMGCAIFPQQKNNTNSFSSSRGNKKTDKIDCRKKSSQALDMIVENITTLQDNIDQPSIDFACKILQQHSLFCTLQKQEILKIASSMKYASAEKDQYIFKEGDSGACFFLIKDGAVSVEVQGQEPKTLGKGDCFGQVALIYHTKRTASVKCRSNQISLLFIKSKQLKQILKGIRQKNNQKTRSLIQNVQIFSLLTNKQKYTLLNTLVREHYKKGTVLFTKNDVPICFYIIETGKVSLVFNDPNKKDIVLGELESFGQSTFKKNGKREGTATVEEDLVCLTINEDRMKECLGGTLSSIVFHNIKKWALKSSGLFHNFDNKEIDQIALQFITKHTKTGGVVMEADKPVNALVICIEGKINNKPVGTLFNEEYYYNHKDAKLQKDMIKNEAGVYAILGFDKLKEILQTLNTKGSIAVARRRQSVMSNENENSIDLDSLDYITKLGEGQFGLVHLVKDNKSGNLFALKCLQKEKIIKQAMQDSAVSERQILASLCHPLIVGYYKAYQDRKNIYFLLQYIYGMEMFDAIREIGILNKIITRFYLGSLVLAVQYLHSRNIIYRDIKPENSIVNHQGRVFLIDMGTAKVLKADNGYRTDTIIGTPHYMAPEVMQGKGYSFQADYWSLGAIFYELICGRLPFAESEQSPYKIYSFVMQNQLTFPTFLNDELAKTLIKRLLCKNVQTRLVGGFAELRNSQYFQGFNWDDLYQGKMIPPYIPRKFRKGNSSKYSEMQGYPLRQFLYGKKKTGRKLTQQFQVWNTNSIV